MSAWHNVSMTYNVTMCNMPLAPQYMSSGLMNMATSSDEYNFLTLPAIWTDRGYYSGGDMKGHETQQRTDPGSCHLSTSSSVFEYLYTNVGVHFTSPSWVAWTHLNCGRNYTSERDSNLASCHVCQRACMHPYHPATPQLHLLQLLLPNCVCCSPIASASAAAPRLRLHLLHGVSWLRPLVIMHMQYKYIKYESCLSPVPPPEHLTSVMHACTHTTKVLL